MLNFKLQATFMLDAGKQKNLLIEVSIKILKENRKIRSLNVHKNIVLLCIPIKYVAIKLNFLKIEHIIYY